MAFKEDLQSFIDFLKTTDNPDETHKEYRKLVKKFHPDHAQEKDKELYNDYILLINKVFSEGKTKTKETIIEKKEDVENKTYIFSKIGPDGKTYTYKCRNYSDYLFKVARYEYDIGHDIFHRHGLLSKEALNQNSLEVMQHYWNSIKCYKHLLKTSKDPVIISSVQFDLKMVQDAVNILSRTIAESNEKGIMQIY